MNRTSQSPLDLKLGSITSAQMKKLKLQEAHSMISYMEEALKRKIEELPKLFTMCSVVNEQSREQIGSRVLILDSIDSRSSALCDWGFEAIVSSRFLLSIYKGVLSLNVGVEATKSLIEVLQSKEVILGRIWIQLNNER
ncbi:hypothetical protein M9H77_36242 [Catharanthus roseus]|uniref:Uncharacterized protein n=1 Tax=Catharanthus roseus TaxID=4058 RepID=A0ACB9ZVH5_CATRO|nr:hypothetical protein M9H77_36242 [Catharanthus roseus]